MQIPERIELANYRLIKAEDCLSAAKFAHKANDLATSANRSYYAMFHAVRALLALDKFDSKHHSVIIGYFNQHYVATGKIDKSYHRMLSSAFRIRNKTDYEDFYVIGLNDAQKQLNDAISFVAFLKEKFLQFKGVVENN